MQTNFGLSNNLFEVETVMVQVGEDEPVEAIQIDPIEGPMVGNKFTISNFRFSDLVYDNGDRQLAFDVSFNGIRSDKNDVVVAHYQDTITAIANKIVQDAFTE
jgi:hypothetical protein